MKKIISTIALATSIGAVFAGCGAGASDNSTGNDYSDGSWQQDEEEDYYYPLPGETSTSYDDNNTTPSDSYIDQPATEPATDYVPPTEYIPDDSGSQGTDYSGGDSSYSDGTGQSEW